MGNVNQRCVVIAIGGHALAGEKGDDADSLSRSAASQLVEVIRSGWRVVLTHGNGPQVGRLLRQQDETQDLFTPYTLDTLVASTQGILGYTIQRRLHNHLADAGLNTAVVCMTSRVVVDPKDLAFQNPTKPVGQVYDEQEARVLMGQYGWTIAETKPKKWRRMVASPEPKRIVEIDAIHSLLAAGVIPIVLGGGGVPVVQSGETSELRGVAAVIDKDLSSSLLARELKADAFVVATAVSKVSLDFGRPSERSLDTLTLDEADSLAAEGHFPAGSMGPKVEACRRFTQNTGRPSVIAHVDDIEQALNGHAGTRLVPDGSYSLSASA